MKRLEALDAARFLAFCGMVLVNFRIAAQVAPGNDWASTVIDLLEGRAAALFVILAGIGIGIVLCFSIGAAAARGVSVRARSDQHDCI